MEWLALVGVYISSISYYSTCVSLSFKYNIVKDVDASEPTCYAYMPR